MPPTDSEVRSALAFVWSEMTLTERRAWRGECPEVAAICAAVFEEWDCAADRIRQGQEGEAVK